MREAVLTGLTAAAIVLLWAPTPAPYRADPVSVPCAAQVIARQRAATSGPAAPAEPLTDLARQLRFPLFVPRHLPPGLTQRRLRSAPEGVELAYVPAGEPGTAIEPRWHGVNIMQRKATPSDAAQVPDRAEPMRIGAAAGWCAPALRTQFSATGALLTLMRDGTWIALSSFTLSCDELVRIAASLEPVPGGHPPLPNPVPRRLEEVRKRVSFPVFVPTDVPPGLTPEPPIGGDESHPLVRIIYHAPDGSAQLDVLNGPAGCCLDADPRKTGEPVPVRGSLPGHFLDMAPAFGGPILWWQEDGAYIALAGPRLRKGDLLRIAASMSKTAGLPLTELPARRPRLGGISAPPVDHGVFVGTGINENATGYTQ